MFSFGDDDNGIIWNERKNKGEREGGTLTSGKKKKKGSSWKNYECKEVYK